MEGDRSAMMASTWSSDFNPRPPHGGRLCHVVGVRAGCMISIHALRMEGDSASLWVTAPGKHFNPRPPHGGRRDGQVVGGVSFVFQSTPSAWRATGAYEIAEYDPVISIHALRMEGDFRSGTSRRPLPHFNPRPPHGGRLSLALAYPWALRFQSTPSAWRATFNAIIWHRFLGISIHALRMEGDCFPGSQNGIQQAISIHALRMEGDCDFMEVNSMENISIHALRMEGDVLLH